MAGGWPVAGLRSATRRGDGDMACRCVRRTGSRAGPVRPTPCLRWDDGGRAAQRVDPRSARVTIGGTPVDLRRVAENAGQPPRAALNDTSGLPAGTAAALRGCAPGAAI